MNRVLVTAIALSLLTACSRSSAPQGSEAARQGPAAPASQPASSASDVTAATSTPAPAETAAPAASPTPAAPKGPTPLPVTSSAASSPGATAPLSFNDPTLVDPASRFHVEAAVALVDARLSLLDSDDALIAATESHEIGRTWTRFTLVPDAPLRPGSRYVLRLDGATERDAHDSDGRAYQVATWPILVAGDPPPAEKPTPKGKKRR